MSVSRDYDKINIILDAYATQFAIDFDVNTDDYGDAINIKVYLGLDELTQNVDYTISNKTINYPDAVNHVGEKLTIYRETPIEQPVDFVDNGNFTLEDIEAMGDRAIMILQEQGVNMADTINAQESAERAEQYKDIAIEKASDAEDWAVGTRSDGETPQHSSNNAKVYADDAYVYASDASTYRNDALDFKRQAEGWAVGKRDGVDVGNTSPYYHNNSKYYSDYASSTVGAHSTALTYLDTYSANVDTVAGISSDIATVASNTSDISTVATDISDVSTVASDISDVSTVASGMSNINSVAGDLTNIDTVAADISDVSAVAGDITKVSAVADDLTNIDDVADNKTNIDTVASNVTDVGTVASNMSSVNTVATNVTDIGTVATDISDVSAVAGNATNINTVAGISSDVTTVAGISSNVTSVAGNATNINSVAGNATNINAVAGNATNINAVAGNSTNINTVATNMGDINDIADNLTGILASDDYADLSRQYDEGKHLDGTDVTSGDPGYNNNAKYYAQQASLHGIQSLPYGVSTTAAATVTKEVSIPEVTTLNDGQVIVIKPTVTSTVASSKIKLNSFDAYKMLYNAAEITTSTDSVVWSANIPSMWILDDVSGTKYWRFLGHGLDSNTTYTLNYSVDAGKYHAGDGSYAITRYAICAQLPDGRWEKITDPTATYSTGTSKTVNTHGFILNQLRYYSGTSNFATNAELATNALYEKAASVSMSYSTNCSTAPGWAVGDYIYLVGTIGVDGLFYLDTTKWWDNALPTTNDGKLYIRLGLALTTTDSTMSFFSDRPVFYHDGNKLCRYVDADNIVTASGTLTFTNKTIDFADNTLTGVASTSTSQTLTNKTIDKADNTVTCTPTVISANTTLNPTKEMYVIVDTADVTITLGTAPYEGYALSIMCVAGIGGCKVQYTNGTSVTDAIWGVQPTTYIYLGSGEWRIAEGATLNTFATSMASGVNEWKTYRGNGTYNFFYSATDCASIYDTPSSFCTVTITWGTSSQASAVCVVNYHSSGYENRVVPMWTCNYSAGTWSKWVKIMGNGSGTVTTKSSLASGWTGNVYWTVKNGICMLDCYAKCSSTGTSKTVLTDVPEAKMGVHACTYAARGLVFIETGSTTLKSHVSSANENQVAHLVYPVADDWVES